MTRRSIATAAPVAAEQAVATPLARTKSGDILYHSPSGCFIRSHDGSTLRPVSDEQVWNALVGIITDDDEWSDWMSCGLVVDHQLNFFSDRIAEIQGCREFLERVRSNVLNITKQELEEYRRCGGSLQ